MVQVLFHFNRNIQPKKNRDSVIVIICVHIQRAEAEAKKKNKKFYLDFPNAFRHLLFQDRESRIILPFPQQSDKNY